MTLTEPRADLASSETEVLVFTDRCAGCQECVVRCPTGALSIDADLWLAVADPSLCVGCRQCERTCPFSAIAVSGPMRVAGRAGEVVDHPGELIGNVGEVRRGFSSFDEVRAEAARCLSCPDPTCVRGCPAHNDIPGFIAAVRDGDLAAAHEVLRRTSVLPDVCSRVCDQASQCEGACSWALAGGEPVSIGRIERFVADNLAVPPPEPRGGHAGLSVAVVGAGPAGIGAAWSLVEAGASVRVYEKDDEPGGLCGWGIPDFTLPASVAARPWRQLVDAGVELHLGEEVTAERLEALLDDNDAVVLAHGASKPMRLSVPGADLEGVTDATTFLKAARATLAGAGTMSGLRSALGLPPASAGTRTPRVLVLGAGNTAMDVARTARRLGMGALCVDWLDEANALARPDELAEARDEGVEVRFLRTLSRLEGAATGARVARAYLARTAQERPDRPPRVLEVPPEVVDVDLVVMAMGYRVDPALASLLPGTPLRREARGVPDRHWTASGLLAAAAPRPGRRSVGELALGRERGVDAATLPFRDRLWVAGDALVGPATVVEAMAQGRRAAAAILAARPRRPGAAPEPGPRRVLVAYESRGGTTARAAEELGGALSADGDDVRVLPIAKVGPVELVAADLVVIGTWVEGRVVAGVRPARATRDWLAGLGPLGGIDVGLFCTYAVSPKRALGELRAVLEDKGARVVGEAAFGRHVLRSSQGPLATARFADELAAAVPAAGGTR